MIHDGLPLSSFLLPPFPLLHTHTQTQVSVDPSQDAIQVLFSERDPLVVTDDTKIVFHCLTVSGWRREKGDGGGGWEDGGGGGWEEEEKGGGRRHSGSCCNTSVYNTTSATVLFNGKSNLNPYTRQ